MKEQSWSKIWYSLKGLVGPYFDLLQYHDETNKQKFVFANFKKILPFALITLFLSMMELVIYFFFLWNAPTRFAFTSICFYLVVINILFLILFFQVLQEKEFPYRKAQWVNFCFLFFEFVGFLGFALFEVHYQGTFHYFILMGWMFTIFTFLTPLQAIPFALFSASLILITYPNHLSFPMIMNVIVPTVCFLTISQCLYYTNKRYFMGEAQLYSKNLELQKQLKKDHLTDVFNRYGLDSHIQILLPYAIFSKIPVAVLMIDIDYFKQFNDQFGHLEGDHCLLKIAQAIQVSTKKDTDLVCRFGGEEFLVFLYDIESQDIEKVTSRIQDAIERLQIPTAKKDVSPFVSVSIGASYGVLTEKKDFEKLIALADQELYLAKSKGRNTTSIH